MDGVDADRHGLEQRALLERHVARQGVAQVGRERVVGGEGSCEAGGETESVPARAYWVLRVPHASLHSYALWCTRRAARGGRRKRLTRVRRGRSENHAGAAVVVPALALRADPARATRLDGDAVADLDVGDRAADLDDDRRRLVPEDHGLLEDEVADAAVLDVVGVRAANRD